MISESLLPFSFALGLQNKFDGSDLFQRYTKVFQNNNKTVV